MEKTDTQVKSRKLCREKYTETRIPLAGGSTGESDLNLIKRQQDRETDMLRDGAV